MTAPFLKRGEGPKVLLAPMEGVTDFPMRALLTEVGGYVLCASEFLRISQDVPPLRVFQKHAPELKTQGVTSSGVVVQLQLLGGDPEKLAQAASLACEAGAKSVDLNFGCPAPTVNRHDGGATLLKFPTRLRNIVESVRKAVPRSIPVSAKLRLGWDSADPIHENADRVAEAGADWLTIHARTRMQGYAPPADWRSIGQVQRRLSLPVVANGDIWSYDDYLRCVEITGCDHVMLGRGALVNPWLAREICSGERTPFSPIQKEGWLPFFRRFQVLSENYYSQPGYVIRRIKQWMNLVKKQHAISWFDEVKRLESFEELKFAIGAVHS